MKQLYPMRLISVLKSPIWGGTRLSKEWNKPTDAPTVGESWELTVREKEQCVIANGIYKGKTLGTVIDLLGHDLTGGDFGSRDFPLLVKLIDAADRLSVQVHPNDDYALRVENDRGKTEMWYIVEAETGAEIICGLAEGTDTADFARAVEEGRPESGLRHIPVHAGETYFIPAGLPHAIGKGILIAEIQQNCDLTYRVYDYERRGADGSLRELHVKKALDVIRSFDGNEIESIRYSRTGGVAESADVLAHCDYFRVEKLCLTVEKTHTLQANGKMLHLLCLSGKADAACNGESYEMTRGDSYLLPAALDALTLVGDAELLVSSVG